MTYRQIHTEIWDDPWFLELESDAKLLFVYLFSNKRTNMIGLYELSPRQMAFETGLALAQKIVLDHGGDIAVQSAAGAGTRVTGTLPLRSAHKAA